MPAMISMSLTLLRIEPGPAATSLWRRVRLLEAQLDELAWSLAWFAWSLTSLAED
jgi:hypothetical protein